MRDTIDMAREAGFNLEQGFLLRVTGIDEDLKRFEALVRADERALAAPVQEPVAEDVVEAYCKAWGESFSQANKFDVVSPISDDLKKHIRAGLEAAFAATHQQGLQVATPPAAPVQGAA
jgi:hypothetical protein